MRLLLAATLTIALLALAGCGGDEESTTLDVVPAAGSETPPSDPSGASYDINGNEYLKLSAKRARAVASDYVEDNPEECSGADPARVYAFAFSSIGIDYPLTEPIGELLAEGCAADLQSG